MYILGSFRIVAIRTKKVGSPCVCCTAKKWRLQAERIWHLNKTPVPKMERL